MYKIFCICNKVEYLLLEADVVVFNVIIENFSLCYFFQIHTYIVIAAVNSEVNLAKRLYIP